MPLNREPNMADPDGLYAALIDAHADLSEAESAALNARLVLLLANHIGNPAVLAEALTIARNLGHHTIYLETMSTMDVAQHLYRKLGFRPLPGPLGATGHSGCDCFYALELA